MKSHILYIATVGLLGINSESFAEQTGQDTRDSLQKIVFQDRSQISGSLIDSSDKHKLRIQSKQLKSHTPLKLETIRRISFPSVINPEHPMARVTIWPRFRVTSSDAIAGKLREITEQHVVLDTTFAGTLNIQRGYVCQIQHLRRGKGFYRGPNSPEDWTILPDRSWQFNNGTYVSKTSGQIGKDLELTEKSHISFQAEFKNAMRFKLRLYTADTITNRPDAYYEVNINRSYAYLQTRGQAAAGQERILGGARWRQIKIDTQSKRAQFDIFADRKKGSFTIYINNKKACVLNSQLPDPLNLGTGVAFLAEERYLLSLSDISVEAWNGTLPNKVGNPKPVAQAKSAFLTDTTNKIIFVKNLTLDQGTFKIQTPQNETRELPLNSWEGIQFPIKKREPKKYAHDIRIHTHSGSRFIVRLDSLKNGKIHGYHQALGKLSISLSEINSIEFNIYADEHKAP